MIGQGETLVERDEELRRSGAALDLIADGAGRVISVEGPAGIGKSVLIDVIRSQATERGFRVLSARGSELEIDFPFGVVRQLFEGGLADRAERAAALADAAAPAATVFDAAAAAEAAAGGSVSFSVLHGLYWMTLNICAEEPALLVVDDLHWCDRPSLRYLAYLANRLDGASIGLVTGLRSTEPGADPALVAGITGEVSAVAVRPGPLSAGAVGQVVEERLERAGGDDFSAACERVTGGNPLLLGELLSALTVEGADPAALDAGAIDQVGPQAISRTVLPRLRRLPPEATEIARAVAILGDGTDIATIAALSGHDAAGVARVTGALARAEILRSGAPLGFVHPLVRAAIYEDIPAGERQLQHARAAELMNTAGANVEKVAAQLLAAPPTGEAWAAERLTQAAAMASASGGIDSAVTYLTRLLAEPLDPAARPGVLLQLGMAEAGTGGPHAVEHLDGAYRTLEQPELKGVAAYALARYLLFVGEAQRSADLAAEALRELPEGVADVAGIVESVELIALYFGAEVADAEERYRKLRDLPEDPGGGESVLAAAAAYDWVYRGGTAEQCSNLAAAAMERAIQMEVDTGLTWIVANGVMVAAERAEAMELWERALARSHQQGSMFGLMSVQLWRGFSQLRHGELREAEDSLRAGIEQIKLLGGATLDYAHGLLASTLIAQGRVDEAERMLFAIERPTGVADGAMLWRAAEVELLLAQGKSERALEAGREHVELCDWRVNPAFAQGFTFQARALEQLGRTDEAVDVLRHELELAEQWGAPGTVGRTLRLLGEYRREEGEADLERAIELLEASPMKLELARALAAHGSFLRRKRKPTEARESLRRAFELAEVCGAHGLAAEIRTELHATGARPRTSALKGPGSLTASEKRVADMAAEGQTNKQIAQGLYVTPKTVEVHLSNAYRKLEISSRRELAAALAE